MPFDWYLRVEKNLFATYFVIPFKRRQGEKVSARHAGRRASAYDISDIPEWTAKLLEEGCEIGVHGIDAWHSTEKGRKELQRVAEVSGICPKGIRMHWLLRDENTYRVLEDAGYAYDSTAGYNETPGYRCGTTQVFRPLSAEKLFEIPMHIQDGALFFGDRLGLTQPEAWKQCEVFIGNARKLSGVLTVLWHDRSPGPERFWDDCYLKLIEELKALPVWFGTASQVVSWFRSRREVTFERADTEDDASCVRLRGTGRRIEPALNVRIYSGINGHSQVTDIAWDGSNDFRPALPAAVSSGGPREVSSLTRQV